MMEEAGFFLSPVTKGAKPVIMAGSLAGIGLSPGAHYALFFNQNEIT